MKLKNHEEFLEELKLKNKTVLIIGKYVNDSTKINTKCVKCGYIWQTTPNSLLHNHGCPKCAKNIKKTQNEFVEELRTYNKNIEVIGSYLSANVPIKVKCCICGNEWKAKPSRLLHGAQCMNCVKPHTSFMEQFMLISFKRVLGEENVISRDTTIIGVELDIYIPKYGIAIEPGTWLYHKNKVNNIDKEKRIKCKEKGVRLITVYDTYPKNTPKPFKEDCYVYDGFLNEYGYKRLSSLIIEIFKIIGICDVNMNWNEIANQAYEECHYNANEEFILKLNNSYPNLVPLEKYKGSHISILVNDISCNHEPWLARPETLLKGVGCPKCGINKASRKKTKSHENFIDELKIKSPNINVLGKYTKATNRIDVECNVCGMRWSPLAYSLMAGKGCPHCSAINAGNKRNNKLKTKTTKEFKIELKKINKSINVLGNYINNKTKIMVECKNCNHKWEVVPNSLLNGHGCPICNRKK